MRYFQKKLSYLAYKWISLFTLRKLANPTGLQCPELSSSVEPHTVTINILYIINTHMLFSIEVYEYKLHQQPPHLLLINKNHFVFLCLTLKLVSYKKNNLNLRINTKSVTDWADASVYACIYCIPTQYAVYACIYCIPPQYTVYACIYITSVYSTVYACIYTTSVCSICLHLYHLSVRMRMNNRNI